MYLNFSKILSTKMKKIVRKINTSTQHTYQKMPHCDDKLLPLKISRPRKKDNRC